jgi:hypothetical protein
MHCGWEGRRFLILLWSVLKTHVGDADGWLGWVVVCWEEKRKGELR